MTGVDCEALPKARELWLPTHVMEYYTAEDMLAFTEELRRKSAAYDALVALPATWRAWRNDPDHPVEGCASDERAAEIFDRCADDLARLLVSDDRPSHTAGDGNG